MKLLITIRKTGDIFEAHNEERGIREFNIHTPLQNTEKPTCQF